MYFDSKAKQCVRCGKWTTEWRYYYDGKIDGPVCYDDRSCRPKQKSRRLKTLERHKRLYGEG